MPRYDADTLFFDFVTPCHMPRCCCCCYFSSYYADMMLHAALRMIILPLPFMMPRCLLLLPDVAASRQLLRATPLPICRFVFAAADVSAPAARDARLPYDIWRCQSLRASQYGRVDVICQDKRRLNDMPRRLKSSPRQQTAQCYGVKSRFSRSAASDAARYGAPVCRVTLCRAPIYAGLLRYYMLRVHAPESVCLMMLDGRERQR